MVRVYIAKIILNTLYMCNQGNVIFFKINRPAIAYYFDGYSKSILVNVLWDSVFAYNKKSSNNVQEFW